MSSADEDVAVSNHVKQRISPEPLLQRLDITVFLYHKIWSATGIRQGRTPYINP